MSLFKTTGDAIELPGGHKLPISVLLVGATVLGAFVLMRRHAAPAPAPVAIAPGAAVVTQNDIATLASAQTQNIAGLESQVNQLAQLIAAPPAPASTPGPGNTGQPATRPAPFLPQIGCKPGPDGRLMCFGG